MNAPAFAVCLVSLLVFSDRTIGAQTTAAASNSDSAAWQSFNRTATHDQGQIHLNAKPDDGLLWLKGVDFSNGTIELEVKGKDLRGQSFVGVAFHGRDDRTFDAIYFRPFNFTSADRAPHSVQYVAMPANDWSALRTAFPGKYENAVKPVPDPNEWFRVRVVVRHPSVKVYVNQAVEPSLQVDQLSDRKSGRVGLWVGNGSEGWFRNLRVTAGD